MNAPAHGENPAPAIVDAFHGLAPQNLAQAPAAPQNPNQQGQPAAAWDELDLAPPQLLGPMVHQAAFGFLGPPMLQLDLDEPDDDVFAFAVFGAPAPEADDGANGRQPNGTDPPLPIV